MNKARILHLVIDLSGYGGAEMTLLRYLAQAPDAAARHRIVTLKGIRPGPSVGAEIERLGVTIVSLGINGLSDVMGALPRLLKEARGFRPDLLSAWLYYPSLIATLLAPLLPGSPRVVWHIRSLPYVSFRQKPARWLSQRLLAMLSRIASVRLVSKSEAARAAHGAIGFKISPQRWTVIPNAIDATRYAPNAEARARIRAAIELPNDAILIGAVGRNVPEKGYPDLFAAFGDMGRQLPADRARRVHLMIAGRDISFDTPSIAALADKTGLPRDRFRLLGARSDIPDLLAAMDVFVMPSRSESFPNALAEAMAAGLTAVSTDVGDCRIVLGDDRFVATAKPGETLADRLTTAATMDAAGRTATGAKNRSRVTAAFTPDRMAAGFDAVFGAK